MSKKLGTLSRRGFIGTTLGLLAACGGGNKGSSPPTGDKNPEGPIIVEETPKSINRTFNYIGPNNLLLIDEMGANHSFSDGVTVNTWGFATMGFNGDRQLPSPVIELIQDQAASITLQSDMPHSIHFHGLDVDQANDGVPLTSGYVAATLNRDFGQVGDSPRLGSQYRYEFTPTHAGTYIYHCHVDTVLHVEMGMIGTVIVRPPEGDINRAWQGGPFFDKEYIWQLHCVDSSWHQQTVSGAFSLDYNADYFLINGNDVVDNDPTVAIAASSGQRILIRAVNVGFLPALINLGNQEFVIIASDGRPLKQFLSTQQVLIGPGERYDLLYTINPAPANGSVQYYDIANLNAVLGQVSVPITAI